MILPILSFAAALLLALVLVPVLARWIAEPVGLLDQPDNNRKLHRKPIPLVGGIAVFLSILVTAGSIYFFGNSFFESTELVLKPSDHGQFLGLLIGSAFLLLIGIVDDSIGLRGRQKLLGQIIAIGILIAFDFKFEKMEVWGTQLEFGIFSMLIVMFWCLAVVNSINLLDGADGFAATIGIVMSISLAIMAIYGERTFDAIIMLALAGGLLGFLRYNFPPAKVFLGDAGSMLIGFILAAISIRCTLKQATTYAFFAPVALLAIPFLDTFAAIVRRKMTGRSIYSVDRGHLHHSLAKRGFGPRISLLWIGLLCSTTAAGGIIALIYQQSEYALLSIGIVVFVMIFGRLFGSAEVELVSNKAKSIGRSIVGNRATRKPVQQSTVQLQGDRNWNEVWDELCKFADDHEINLITFDINLPWLHESFHAKRRRTDAPQGENNEWYAEIPLVIDGKIFGRVELISSVDGQVLHHEIITNLLKLTGELEPVLRAKAVVPSDLDVMHAESNGALPSKNGDASLNDFESESATTK